MLASAWFGLAYHPDRRLSAAVPSPRPAPVHPGGLGWLRASAGRMVDSEGRTVILRGFNDAALLSASFQPPPLEPSDADLIHRSGFDVVRLPVAWSLLEPRRGQIDGAYLDRVQAAVRMLNRHHLWVVLDMHVGIAWGPDSEVPAWARLPAIPDLKWFPDSHWRDTLSPAQLAALSYFWVSTDWQRDFALSWEALARRFRDDPGLAGYDIYNEPHPVPLPPRIFSEQWLWPFYARMVTAIGSVDPNHMFIVESTLFANFPTPIDHLSAPNLVYSPHFYVGSLIKTSADQAGSVAAALRERSREAARVPAALWIGEIGIDHLQPGASGWTQQVLDGLDRSGTGWAWWQWRQDAHWGVRTADGRLQMDVLRMLARPYLAAAPAGVASTAADGERGHLEVRVAPGHGAGRAIVSWSALTLSAPHATGACLTAARWDPGAARLTLDLAAGRGCRIELAAG